MDEEPAEQAPATIVASRAPDTTQPATRIAAAAARPSGRQSDAATKPMPTVHHRPSSSGCEVRPVGRKTVSPSLNGISRTRRANSAMPTSAESTT